MNKVIELRGKRFIQESKPNGGGGVAINGHVRVASAHIKKLESELSEIDAFWDKEKRPFDGILIGVHYNKIVAKSNRISGLFKGITSNSAIVGAKFNKTKDRHIITYYLTNEDLKKSLDSLEKTNAILAECYSGEMTKTTFDNLSNFDTIDYANYEFSKTQFRSVIADVSYIDHFSIEIPETKIKEGIVTLYNTGKDTNQILQDLGINVLPNRTIDGRTTLLDKNQLQTLYEKAPYLVAMATEDLASLSPGNFDQIMEPNVISIPPPKNEPTIGVIDTLFDNRVYFSNWVEYHEMVDSSIPKTPDDSRHGTSVSSIIVDGPRLNPWLDDGCGRFKVRHFGVASGKQFSSFSVIRHIRNIIRNNSDIKVWNISLGSNQEINDNFISAESAALDQIQYENDVIFVIAGTNKPSEDIIKIGSPADSINSLVVNSVSKNGLSTKYSRRGLALSFFAKPDISYYGGSEEQYIYVCEPLGLAKVAGTSYAAPWIARKMSYLIDVLGLNREAAKAMIIDAARGWNAKPTPEEVALYGHGIVPIKIQDIINTKDDEIRFIVTDVSEKWNTYCYDFPIPIKDDYYPYIARATMCYFPICDRAQGVDYTNTELNLHFGRIKDGGGLNEINDDKQNQDDTAENSTYYILEGSAREKFRKWDNVKYITEAPKSKHRPKKSYSKKNWGMEIKTSNRLDPADGMGIRFGVVVTIKEINGVNRVDEFIKNCHLNGWLVNEIDVENRINMYEKINEEISLE